MTVKARVEYDPAVLGVRIFVSQAPGLVLHFGGHPSTDVVEPGAEAPPDAGLVLGDEESRALYEALAEYYGHSNTSAKMLRLDYEAERVRVDKLIDFLISDSP